MCGILGTNVRIDPAEFSAALNSMAHRGPDDQGTYYDDFVSLGHRRLSILDVSQNGHQPMCSADENAWIIFNGEIYNHMDLRAEFGSGYPYRSHTDTETILHGYQLHGHRIVEKLNGIFTFALYDRKRRELFVARDHLGVKPLYYCHRNGNFAFASEIKALVELGSTDQTLNSDAFLNYLYYLWSPGEITPFESVRKLPPGHYILLNLDRPERLETKKFYEVPFDGTRNNARESDLIDELDERLQVAVKRQLLSDVPVGFFLSGGLDSSLIVAMARKHRPAQLDCFTIDTLNDRMDGDVEDLRYAEQVARHLDVKLHRIPARADLINSFDEVIWHLDEPQADPACSLVWEICKSAREMGTVVLLSGTAGDDLLSGYRRHQIVAMEWLFGLFGGSFGRGLRSVFQSLPLPGTLGRRLRKLSNGWGLSKLDRFASYFRWCDLATAKSFFQPDFLKNPSFDPTEILRDSLKQIPNERDDLNRLLFWDLKFFLADHNLNYTDKMSMAAGVETRVPFLDLELVEFACRLPVNMKMKGMTTKYLMRKVAERYLPRGVIYRPKTGFGAPLRTWIKSGKLDHKISRLLNADGVTSEVLALDQVKSFVAKTKADQVDGSYAVLTLLAFQSWLDQFCSSKSSRVPSPSHVA